MCLQEFPYITLVDNVSLSELSFYKRVCTLNLGNAYLLLKIQTWTGIYVDLLNSLKFTLNFTYTMKQQKVNGYWNGVVQELHEKNADIGLCDLSNAQFFLITESKLIHKCFLCLTVTNSNESDNFSFKFL